MTVLKKIVSYVTMIVVMAGSLSLSGMSKEGDSDEQKAHAVEARGEKNIPLIIPVAVVCLGVVWAGVSFSQLLKLVPKA